ncbi:MAG: nicotinate (nicotinamide) nucleotide adenylyltransferase [Bacteroidetes bacterium]|nr:nicotinate (nicotinamide) nucleotide adenylyltransferase [Bacteroidota bacterium]
MINLPNKIGIMGGSFNPVHNAHCIMADCFVREVNCDVCYLVPSAISPLKPVNTLVSSEHRLAMLKLATQNNPKLEVSDIEIIRGGISYTIDTIRWFQSHFPESKLYLLIGADQAVEFTRWKEWKVILQAVQLCIASREGIDNQDDILKALTVDDRSPIWLNCPTIQLSSTMIRQYLNFNKPVKNFLADEVVEYIHINKLYKLTI